MHPRILSGRPLRPDWPCAAALARSLAFTPVVAARERPSRGRSEGLHRCSNTPTHLMLSPPAGQTDMAQAEISLLAFLHLGDVFCLRQFSMRIN